MPSDFDQLVHQHGARIRRIGLQYAASRERDRQAAVVAQSVRPAVAQAATSMADVLASFLAILGDVDAAILMMYLIQSL
jgi:hypothetical protein